MSYNTLPSEIVNQIVKSIRPNDIENFAIIDKRTYNLSHDRLEKLSALRRNSQTMATRFTSHSPPLEIYGLPSSYVYTPGQDLDEINAYYSGKTNSTVASSEYTELNGDLYWLQPLSESALETNVWCQGEHASKEHLDALVSSAKQVGVEIPPVFLRFMGSKELLERMLLGGDYFYLGPSLVKCNPEDDNDGGGYVIRFLCDQQDCLFWFLYVAPGGYHAVLKSSSDTDVHCWRCSWEVSSRDGDREEAFPNHPRPILYKGVPAACEKLDLELISASFELWLAMKYFEGCRLAARSSLYKVRCKHFGR